MPWPEYRHRKCMQRKISFWKEHMEYLERKAYAKINLNLNVLGKRPDGFYELETLMQAVDLSDRVRTGWEPCPTGLPSYAAPCADCPGELAVDVRTSTPALPGGPENLAYRAAVSMHAHYRAGICERITVDIEKNIPIAAGLAGSSATRRLSCCRGGSVGLRDERIDLGACSRARSDAPFCGSPERTASVIATGRGEILQPVMPLSCKVLLSTPDCCFDGRGVCRIAGVRLPGAFRHRRPGRSIAYGRRSNSVLHGQSSSSAFVSPVSRYTKDRRLGERSKQSGCCAPRRQRADRVRLVPTRIRNGAHLLVPRPESQYTFCVDTCISNMACILKQHLHRRLNARSHCAIYIRTDLR